MGSNDFVNIIECNNSQTVGKRSSAVGLAVGATGQAKKLKCEKTAGEDINHLNTGQTLTEGWRIHYQRV